ncbi:MAG: hypothetical protein AAFQ91_04390 [Cyanobacteria bacterium J06621_15]
MNPKNQKQKKQANNQQIKHLQLEPLKPEQLNHIAGSASRVAWG